MFEKDSPQDLLLRGFSREYILDKTGTDVGYHGNAMKKELKGIDRVSYKVDFVESNYTHDEILAVLNEYAACIDAATVLDRLGLAGVNIIKLNILFKGLGLTDEFKDADKKHRKGIMKQGMLDKYGVDNPFKLDDFQQIAAETRKEKYGAEYTRASGSALCDAARETFAEHMADDEFRKKLNEKKCATNMALYGVPYVAQSPVFQVKTRATNLRRYGFTNAMKSLSMRKHMSQVMKKNAPMIAVKSRKTCLGKYGVKYSWESAALRSKMQATMLQRYGSTSYPQSDEYKQNVGVIQSKINATKRKNGTFNTSGIEERIKVLKIFESQYNKDVRYPYLCDFYDKDRDLFIEVNASWTHGHHWYNIEQDAATCEKWKAKSEESSYYSSALYVFTNRDVEKRECAKANNLNYVTFWDRAGMDFDLWFAMGMPLGKDYEHEYSWLPYHHIPEEVDVSNMRLTWSRLSAVVKDVQRKVFYKRELELWNENPLRHGKWGTVQAFLYANRYKYLNKLPHELTDRMLLRAFRISGLHMGYTSFNSSLMRQVIEKYDVKSVYDPCAGWGERMMTCGKLGVSYEGCDINSELFEGYAKLAELIDGFKPVLHNNDSANQLVTGDADAIITCPPYKGIEVYSENGAENLSDEDFAAWWGEVVKNCSYGKAKVFAVQTNQACREVFADALVAQGWRLKEELVFDNNQKSHFHRSNGNDKHEYESMLVFVRCSH